MTIPGYIDYQRREYCKAVACPVQVLLDQEDPDSQKYQTLRSICQTACLHTTHEFHAWLIKQKFEVVRPQ
ncbi:MAG: hypothetical protein LWX83_04380 [Anaerolineae bacterium]|nr:hypothetical protein [Anaerolineae bacterium]